MGSPPLVRLVLLLAALVVANFLLPRALPGSPLAPGGGESAVAFLPAAAQAALRETYALDRPLWEQFRRYLAGLARAGSGRVLLVLRLDAVLTAQERLVLLGAEGQEEPVPEGAGSEAAPHGEAPAGGRRRRRAAGE